MYKPAIVLIAYNRPDSLSRLLESVSRAYYPEDEEVTLIISIDKSDVSEVVKVANEYNWNHGKKLVIERNPRMGLKAHVLACGDLTKEYDSIIVLEDDLYVSPSFYEYSKSALDYSDCDERIGGISLYNHLFNVHARKSFVSVDDGYDNWYFQFASSWGQAYTKSQWNSFKKWYELHKDDDLMRLDIPSNVSGWSEKSWLKFYIAYLIDTNRYFLYPRVSFTTNFGDVGSHAIKADSDLQVPVCMASMKRSFCFSSIEDSMSIYDAFFENLKLKGVIKSYLQSKGLTAQESSIVIDLYGLKPIEDIIRDNDDVKYALSVKKLPYRVINKYARHMRPIDSNILMNISGNDFYLYDLSKADDLPAKDNEAIDYLYEYRGISARQMISIIKYRVLEKIRR